jgi:regulation of enolase protein 1 (concanavalin A-like superfamily)
MATHITPSTTNLDKVAEGYPENFSIAAAPNTDVYASPKHGYRFNSPTIYHKISPATFHKARLTITLHWTLQYDQGGLILVQPVRDTDKPDGKSASKKAGHPRWVKAGIEVKDGAANISVVARETWADWSLTPTRSDHHGGGQAENISMATIEFEKSGNSLKVNVHEGLTRRMVRQVQWVFDGAEEDIWVGVYSARPDPLKEADGKELEVHFSNFEITEEDKQ